MTKRIKIIFLIFFFIGIPSNIFSKEPKKDSLYSNYIRLNLLDINKELDQVLDSLLIYNLNKIDILDEIYFYIYVYEDSLKKNMAIDIGTNLKRELNFTAAENFSGIIKKDNFYFFLLKENSNLVSHHTSEYIDFPYCKMNARYYPIDYDGPVWIYTYNKFSKEIKLWRFDSAINLLE